MSQFSARSASLVAQVPHQGRGDHPQADSGHHPAAHGAGDDHGGPIVAYVIVHLPFSKKLRFSSIFKK